MADDTKNKERESALFRLQLKKFKSNIMLKLAFCAIWHSSQLMSATLLS